MESVCLVGILSPLRLHPLLLCLVVTRSCGHGFFFRNTLPEYDMYSVQGVSLWVLSSMCCCLAF